MEEKVEFWEQTTVWEDVEIPQIISATDEEECRSTDKKEHEKIRMLTLLWGNKNEQSSLFYPFLFNWKGLFHASSEHTNHVLHITDKVFCNYMPNEG